MASLVLSGFPESSKHMLSVFRAPFEDKRQYMRLLDLHQHVRLRCEIGTAAAFHYRP